MARRIWSTLLLCILAMLLSGMSAGIANAQAVPGYVLNGPLLPLILQAPERSWLEVNVNFFSDVWTPPDLEPLDLGATHPPSKIIQVWSGFAWDSNRGDLILYGGGHANYSGNDVYRWHSSNLRWERASLPSDIYDDPVSRFQAIDGVDNAPSSAHTYQNNMFMPIADRFLTWGGAAYDNGGPYLRVSETDPTKTRPVGPYLFDPNRADGNKVGGTTGSHVTRVAPHPEIVGGEMWENRDIHLHLAGQVMPGAHVSGCSTYAVEGGHDVAYVGANNGLGTNLNVYRYQLTDINNPALDQVSQVGTFWVGTAGQTTCGYDASRKLFVRTGTNAIPFLFWDLTTPGPNNLDQRVVVDTTIAGFQSWLSAQGLDIQNCALVFDPANHTYPVWCGAAVIWELHPPASANTAAGWTISQLATAPGVAPPGDTGGTGVLGKWRYAPYFDVFVGLQDVNEGRVWIYKPAGWAQPNPAGNALPGVAVTSPANGTILEPGAPVNLTASASDTDGTIGRVEFYANGIKLGQSTTAPYALQWTPLLVGTYSIIAIAVDNVGGMSESSTVNVTVSAPIFSVTLQRGLAGYTGVGDTMLNATAVSTPYGASNPLYLDGSNYTPLVRFAVFASEGGPVPDGAVIQSATLALYKQYYDNELQLNALQVPWAESQATWLTRQPGFSWTIPGAAGAGSDYIATTDAMTAGSFNPGWVTFDVTSRLRTWANAAGANFGWRLAMTVPNSVNGIQFTSSEYAPDPTQRPKLTLVYAPPPDGQPPGNIPPTVTLDSPSNGASTVLGGSFALSATAGDVDGTVTKVEFLANGSVIGTVTSGPYSMTWVPATVGSFTLTARATDDDAAVTTSNVAVVNVTAPNIPPTVTLDSPSNGASTTLGGSFALSATAGDVDGAVTKVEFLANGSVIGTVTSKPYSMTWVPAAVGSYTLSARATDDDAAATTSSPPVVVSVTQGTGTTTVVMQRGLTGYVGASDTFLDNYLHTTIRGATNPLYMNVNYTPLVRFAIFQSEGGPVPNGVTIQSAKLELYKQYYDGTLQMNALLKPWVESQATWNLSQTGVAWSAGGAAGVGSDYNATTDAQVAAGFNPGWVAFDAKSRVQQWSNGTATNNGWRLSQTSTNAINAIQFNSSEYAADPTLRPKLTIVY